jgi:hypothetical protein
MYKIADFLEGVFNFLAIFCWPNEMFVLLIHFFSHPHLFVCTHT